MPPFTLDKAEIQRLIEAEAVRQGVKPALVVALATQESSLNPHAVGDNGRSIGLFQLQPAAAIDAGGRPEDRYQVASNIRLGVSYFKQQLDKERGNVRRALSRFNRGTPTYQGIGDPAYVENVLRHVGTSPAPAPRRSLGARVVQALSPRSAEAAPTEPSYEQLRGLVRGGASSPPPAAPTAPDYEQLRAIVRGTPAPTTAPGPPTPPAPVPAPGPAGPSGAPPAVPTADTQVQLLQQQEQGRLAAERALGSPTVPGGLGTVRQQVQQFFAPPPPEQLGPTTDMVAEWLPGMELLTVLPRQTQEQVVAALPPAARTAAATGVNTALSAAGVAAGGPVGGVVGSGLGYGVNVALGLEDPSVLGAALSVGVPAVVASAPPVAKAALRKLPGASTAMHQEVAERLGAMKDRLQPPIPAADLYQQAAGANPPIRASAVSREAADVLAREMALEPSLRNPRLVRLAKDLQRLTQAGDVPMEQLYAHQQRVGELVRDFRAKGGVGEGRMKQLYAAFHEDLETAAGKGVAGAQELKDAIAASRKEHMAQEIDDLFQPGKAGITLDPEGRASINGGRLASAWKAKLRRDKVLRTTLSADEKAEVEEIITLAQRLERLRPPKGVQFGSARSIARGAVATGIASATGMNPLIVGAVAMNAPELIGKAMQTSAGRALVKKALQDGGGTIDTTALTAIAAVIRQQMSPPAEAAGP